MHFDAREWAKWEIDRKKGERRKNAVCVPSFTIHMDVHTVSLLHFFSLSHVLSFYSTFCRFVSVQTIKCNNNRSRNEICINLFSIGKIEEVYLMHNWIFFSLAKTRHGHTYIYEWGELHDTGKKLILIEHVRTGT